jgi:hypothetical protein
MDQQYPRERTVRVLQQQDNGLWIEEERTYRHHGLWATWGFRRLSLFVFAQERRIATPSKEKFRTR